jgi:hypothetical protein
LGIVLNFTHGITAFSFDAGDPGKFEAGFQLFFIAGLEYFSWFLGIR